MTWTYHNSKKDDAEFLRQFIAFLQSCISQRGSFSEMVRPEFVPSFMKIDIPIVSDIPGLFPVRLEIGVHQVRSNQWGAISATTNKGNMLGIKPDECIVLEMCPNPHLKRNQWDD